MSQLVCQACGTPVPLSEPIPRDSQCESCGRDLRCCKNCRHFDVRYNNACTETMADPVVEKDRRNFCEYFYFSRAAFTPKAQTASRQAEARAKLNAFFGTAKSPTDRAADARKKLDDLFKKPKTPSDDEP
jgi:hypothetical protein